MGVLEGCVAVEVTIQWVGLEVGACFFINRRNFDLVPSIVKVKGKERSIV